jgi:hypothetical protein
MQRSDTGRRIISHALLTITYWFNMGSEMAVVAGDDEGLNLGSEAFVRPLRLYPDRTAL